MINNLFLKGRTRRIKVSSFIYFFRCMNTGPLQAPEALQNDYFSPAERCTFDVVKKSFFWIDTENIWCIWGSSYILCVVRYKNLWLICNGCKEWMLSWSGCSTWGPDCFYHAIQRVSHFYALSQDVKIRCLFEEVCGWLNDWHIRTLWFEFLYDQNVFS